MYSYFYMYILEVLSAYIHFYNPFHLVKLKLNMEKCGLT